MKKEELLDFLKWLDKTHDIQLREMQCSWGYDGVDERMMEGWYDVNWRADQWYDEWVDSKTKGGDAK